ncbi:L-aminoadipate-semialdehyde dehydrogenase [Purpureocillium lilacinum]|uniref:L-aminoadipate-semialdehyde dehydrogenase n=1 Tax=Purpureocillium lilacinum TaxID=33203 RepID=A0A179GLA1_PURLI|nr:L-aminoadipate-semialdehyde dehydrogenase [Purpureocillium lilacinum]GJN72092.1 putative NRPS-like protein biosynthetic cluster [Purpureocillium lilacinum]
MAVTQARPREPEYGSRLAVNVVDEIAARDPTRPFVFVPRSNKPDDGWVPVTFKQLANAVNHVAHIVARDVKPTSADPFPTLGYVGPNDVRYAIVMLACVKAGCQGFFISPRNSVEGQLRLLKATNCTNLWYAESFRSIVQPWIDQRKMTAKIVPSAEEWLGSEGKPFPYDRPFEEARFEPLCVLHTSGSTGFPKPIVVRQGSMAVADKFRSLPDHHGAPFVFTGWSSQSQRMLMPMPLFHAAGMLASLTILAVFYGLPLALGIPDQIMTPESVRDCLFYSRADSVMLPPSIVEGLCQVDGGLEIMKQLNYVVVGGGNLSQAAGDTLLENGILLSNIIQSTEAIPYGIYMQPNPELWQYFIINTDVMGAVWRCHDEREGVYELFLKRKNLMDPTDQPAFYTFPAAAEWSTGDLYKRHPTLPDHWKFHGRADNVIVFSNGEKLNPVTIEDTVMGCTAIKGALVVGQDRFQPALLLEPFDHPRNEAEKRDLLRRVWPYLQEANREAVAHGRISRQLVMVSDEKIPFARAPKGTVQRPLTIMAYKRQIDDLYSRAEDNEAQDIVALDFSGESALAESIIKLLKTKLLVRNAHPDADLFLLGVDSLQVMQMASILRASAEAAGVMVKRNHFAPRAIYANPTPRQLAAYLLSTINGGESTQSDEEREIAALKGLISKYTKDLPTPHAHRPDPFSDAQTVLVTGTTGSLGAYLLDHLCKLPQVGKVIALNRGKNGGKLRQGPISAARGLSTDFSKVEFLRANLAMPHLGVGKVRYRRLLYSVDRIVHNAWPVNFNISVASFEPHICGVRHLVDFASKASRRVPIIFVSSIGTAMAWKKQCPVPEAKLEDLSLAEMGYGRSKLAGSLILDAAAARGVPTATVRVGQVAGPRSRKGVWNRQEFMPTLIESSLFLGKLPKSIGPGDEVDWMPIEDVAQLVLDVSGVTTETPVSAIHGYFHCVNPSRTTWASLAAALEEHYRGRLEMVTLEEWVAALEQDAGTGASAERNPGVKLLDTYRSMLASAKEGARHVNFDMKRTIATSPTVAGLGPVSPELLRNWCDQWGF